MPVMVNIGKNPVNAAWLLYSPRSVLAELRDAIRSGKYQVGTILATPDEGAKAKDVVDVTIAMIAELPAAKEDAEGEAASPQDTARELAENAKRMQLGITTAEAARNYLARRDPAEGPSGINLPGLQDLADTLAALEIASPDARWGVWYIERGVLRVAAAKEVKPVSGNILNVKL